MDWWGRTGQIADERDQESMVAQLAHKPRRIALAFFRFALVNNQISPLPQTTFRLLPKPQFSTSNVTTVQHSATRSLRPFLLYSYCIAGAIPLAANMREIISLNGTSKKSLGCERASPFTATSKFGARHPLQPGTRLHQPAY